MQCDIKTNDYDLRRAGANEDAANMWRQRAFDMKKRLDEAQGGSAQWIDISERTPKCFHS